MAIFVSDRDGGVKSLFQKDPRLQHILLLHDGGHTRKMVKKQLMEIFKGGGEYGNRYVVRCTAWWARCLYEAKLAVHQI